MSKEYKFWRRILMHVFGEQRFVDFCRTMIEGYAFIDGKWQ